MTPAKAVGDVIIRHTCDGRLICPDRLEKRMVYMSRNGKYFIKLWTREWQVTRVENTSRFICHFAGRTTRGH